MPKSRAIAVVVCSLLVGACSTFGIRSGTETPSYAVAESIAGDNGDEIEVRWCSPRLAAELPEETMAVVRFTGARDPAAIDAVTWALRRGLDAAAWMPPGLPVAYFYDPPWTSPFLRRNDVAVPVRPTR